MKRTIKYFAGVAFAAMLMLTSCHSDDPDAGKIIVPEDKDLISADVPAQGWSGNAQNGILKFAPEEAEDYDDVNSYYAFEMSNGMCQNAVYNVVMPDAMSAKMMAQKLNSGTWIFNEDDEDDDDYFYSTRSRGSEVKVYNMLTKALQPVSLPTVTRASLTLPIPVAQSGRVIYITIPNMEGLSESDLKEVMDIWCGYTSQIPNRVVFGTYENGIYRCSNMQGLGINYLVETEYNAAGYCVLYRTSIMLPNEGWAEFYYAIYEEQMVDYEQKFGQRPELRLVGNTVILDAIILGEIFKADVDALIYALDWMNNCPFLFNIFG